MFLQTVDLSRYIIGPLPTSLCTLNLFLKNVVGLQIVLFFNASIAIKFISIFCLKNPTGLQDDFWTCFVNQVVVAFSFIGQFVSDFLPSEEPLIFFICTGKIKQNVDTYTPPSKNMFSRIITNFTLLAYIIYCIIIYTYKLKHKVKNSNRSVLLISLEKDSLSDLSSNIGYFVLIASYAALVRTFNSFTIESVNEFPFYLLVYLIQLGMANLCVFIQCFSYYLRHQDLRVTVYREIKEYLNYYGFPIHE